MRVSKGVGRLRSEDVKNQVDKQKKKTIPITPCSLIQLFTTLLLRFPCELWFWFGQYWLIRFWPGGNGADWSALFSRYYLSVEGNNSHFLWLPSLIYAMCYARLKKLLHRLKAGLDSGLFFKKCLTTSYKEIIENLSNNSIISNNSSEFWNTGHWILYNFFSISTSL